MADRIGRPPQITRDDVVAAGTAVGLTELSTRAVAGRLGVTPGALYHHVANLDDLRVAIGERITSEIALPEPGEDPVDDLVRLALVLRTTERLHPGIGAFFASVGSEDRVAHEFMAAAAGRLARHGLIAVDATMTTGIVANVAFAFAAREQDGTEPMSEAEGESLLAWVVRSLATGLLADLDRAPWRRDPSSPGPTRTDPGPHGA